MRPTVAVFQSETLHIHIHRHRHKYTYRVIQVFSDSLNDSMYYIYIHIHITNQRQKTHVFHLIREMNHLLVKPISSPISNNASCTCVGLFRSFVASAR